MYFEKIGIESKLLINTYSIDISSGIHNLGHFRVEEVRSKISFKEYAQI